MKKQSFMKGSLILILSVAATKIIGAVFKIPLANLLGGTGMGYFSCAYGLFLPVYAVSVTGLPTAVAKLTSENLAFQKFRNVKKLRSAALLMFAGIGLLASLLICLLAEPFCRVVTQTPEAYPAVLAIAPSVLFGCVMAVYRGYFEGSHNMTPTAVSQVVEAVIKAGLGLWLSFMVLQMAEQEPQKLLKIAAVFGDFGGASANELALPLAAAAAVWGVTLGSLGGMVFLAVCSALEKKPPLTGTDGRTERKKVLCRRLLMIALPVAAGSLVTNLTSLTDLATIVRCLKASVLKVPDLIPGLGVPAKELPAFLYGSFNGLALTVFNLIPAFTNMLGKGALPGISEAWAVKDHRKLEKSVQSVLFATAVIAVPAGLGLTILAEPILRLLFSSRLQEVAVSWGALSIMGPGVIALSVSASAFAVLQAAGKPSVPVKIMLWGAAVKLAGNLILIPIPEIHINGAAISTTACYLVILILSLTALKKEIGVSLNLPMVLLKPMYSGILCAAAAGLTYSFAHTRMGLPLSIVLSIGAGGAVYFFALFLLELPVKKEIRSLF